MPYHLFVDSKNCSGFRKYGCGFRKIVYFRSDFDQYSVLGICLWNPKQRRRSKKSSKVADSAPNMILACYGIRLQYSECCTVWPRNEPFAKKQSNSRRQPERISDEPKRSSRFRQLTKDYGEPIPIDLLQKEWLMWWSENLRNHRVWNS